jgi:AcrR family transcriptional regulator
MPLPRFEKLDDERKESLLTAAAQVFAERGFEAASFNHIIEKAGVSKGAMYYYFADKDDLFCTVLDVALARWVGEVLEPFDADGPQAFWDGCEAMYARSLRFVLTDPLDAALCLSITRAKARLEGHPKLLEQHALMRTWMAGLLAQARAVGAIRQDIPDDLLVHAAMALMDAGDRWLADRWGELKESDVEKTAAMMVGMVRRLGEGQRSEGERR